MKEFICLECLDLEKVLIKLEKPPLESLVDYDKSLKKYTEVYEDDFIDAIEQTNEFQQLIADMSKNGESEDSKLEELINIKCCECGDEFSFNDYIIEKRNIEAFLTEICMILAEEITSHVEFCPNCNIIKDYIEYNNMVKIETGIYKEAKGISLEEFLAKFNLPIEYNGIIKPFLNCDNCNISFSELINEPRIYTFDDIEDYFTTDFEEMSIYAERFEINIKKVEISNFSAFLRSNTMLGLKHRTGSELYKLFERIYKDGKMMKLKEYMILENKKLYRGRVRDTGTIKFTNSEMWNPPIGVSSHGRYNLVGSSVLYLTNDKDIIPHELNYKDYQLLDIATMSINRPLKILDLSNMYGEFGRLLSTSSSGLEILKLEYLLTNYISECCKNIGFHGIKYNGVKEGEYENYALLNFEKEIDISIDGIETYKPSIKYILEP